MRIVSLKVVARFTLLGVVLVTEALRADDYEVMTLTSLGSDALSFNKKAGFISDSDTFFVDGKIVSKTIGKTTYDRTLENNTRFGANLTFGQRFFLRPLIGVEYARHVQEGKEAPRLVVKEEPMKFKPRVDATFITANNLEIVTGATYWYVPAYERRSEATGLNTVSHIGQSSLLAPHLILVKRSGSFEGGCYYKAGVESDQEVKTYNTVDSSELVYKQKLYDPTRVGIFFKGMISEFDIYGEFTAVQAGEGGNKTDNGDTIEEDYLSAKFTASMPLNTGLKGKLGVTHKTLSYADNRNVAIPMIAMTGVHLQALFGSDERYSYLGLAYANGRERQSIPEFNADYMADIYGFSAGLVATF